MKPKRKSIILGVLLLVVLASYTISSRSESSSSSVTSVSPFHTLKTTGAVLSLAFSPDGEMLAAGRYDGTIQLFRVSDDSLLLTMREHIPSDPFKHMNTNTIAFSTDGRILASGHDDGNVRLWQVSTGILLQTLKGNSGRVLSVSFSPNGQMLAMGSPGIITLWRVSDGSILRTFDVGHGIVVFSPDGQTLAVDDGFSIKLLEVSDGSQLRTLTWGKHYIGASSLAFSQDGETLAVGSSENYVLMFRVSDGRLLYDRETLIKNSYHAAGTDAVVFSQNGKVLFTAGSGNLQKSFDLLSTIRTWQASDGRLLHTYKLSGHALVSFSISPDGQTLAAGFPTEHMILLWQRADSEKITFPKFPPSDAAPTQPRLHLTASALGKSANEGGELSLEVPDNLEVEVNFAATSQDQKFPTFSQQAASSPFHAEDFDFVWSVSDGTVSKDQTWNHKFKSGTYEVQVSLVDKRITTQTSTPAVVSQNNNAQEVTVTVKKNDKWGCLGRVGVQCGGSPIDQIPDLGYSVEQGCDKNPRNVCISSMVSVGSIKHDQCCKDDNNGYMCSFPPNLREKNCKNDFIIAAMNVDLAGLLANTADIQTVFNRPWKYPPDGTDKPSSGADKWWEGMVPPGVIIGYDGEGYWGYKYDNMKDDVYCNGKVIEVKLSSPLQWSENTSESLSNLTKPLDSTNSTQQLNTANSTPKVLIPRLQSSVSILFSELRGSGRVNITSVYVCRAFEGKKEKIGNTNAKDNKAKQAAPKTISKVKKVTRVRCNKSSSVLSPSTGSAEEALKKSGVGTDGCAQ